MEILVFDAGRKGFDDGEGNDICIEGHLYYLKNYSGTPDCVDILRGVREVADFLDDNEYNLHEYIFACGYSFILMTPYELLGEQ